MRTRCHRTSASCPRQYIGKTGGVALRQQGGEIDGLTGSTVTSAAVTSGVNTALAVAGQLMKEGG